MGLAPPVSSIVLVPAGPLPLPHAEELAARLSRRVSVPCKVDEAGPLPSPPLLPGRDQADADALLARLEAREASDGVVFAGVTPLDLAVPIFTFVFGRARAGGHAALISLARLDPSFYGLPRDDGLLARRAVDELLHELGHVASLRHCNEAACLMRFAGSVERADLRGSAFCPGCAALLPHWLHAARSFVP